MEKTLEKSNKQAISKEKLQQQYMEFVLLNERTPTSVFAFAKGLKIKEDDFYVHYNSFRALEGDIWKSWFEETLDVLHNDKAYLPYTIREKLLAFYYTWLEIVKKNRSFVLLKFEAVSQKNLNPDFWKSLQASFFMHIQDLIMEGKDTGEIAERPWSKQYDKGFWMQFVYLTKYWTTDDSDGFQQTDALIEKSVNFSLDMISRGAIDSFLDLAKFLYQQNKI